LDLELRFGWTGLLIEADPKNFALVQQKRRNAWLSNSCLATHPYPHKVIFKQNFNVGKIASDTLSPKLEENSVIAQCFPIYSLLAAIGQGVKTVDYFSLDVEGNEFEVLKTIPWEKVNIRVLSVEYIHNDAPSDEIVKYMQIKGYRMVTRVTNRNNLANDFIFVHNSVPVTVSIPEIHT